MSFFKKLLFLVGNFFETQFSDRYSFLFVLCSVIHCLFVNGVCLVCDLYLFYKYLFCIGTFGKIYRLLIICSIFFGVFLLMYFLFFYRVLFSVLYVQTDLSFCILLICALYGSTWFKGLFITIVIKAVEFIVAYSCIS